MGPGEFLNINFFTALFTLFNFIAVFLVLKHFLFKPVMKIIKDRQDEIDQMYKEATSGDYSNLICVCDEYIDKVNERLELTDEDDDDKEEEFY